MKLIIPQNVSEMIESLHGEREAPTSPEKRENFLCSYNAYEKQNLFCTKKI